MGVGLVVVLIVGWILLSGGGIPLVDGGPSGPSSFSFELAGGVRVSSTSRTPPSELAGVASDAGDDIKETMDELYFRAFLDAGSWGDYSEAFALFDSQAAARAQADTEVLTLGSAAGETFESVRSTSDSLTISVLMDKDAPSTAVAEVEFLADATRSDGGTTEIASSGSYYLRQVDGAWRVFAYDVDRDDTTTAAPSPTGSPS